MNVSLAIAVLVSLLSVGGCSSSGDDSGSKAGTSGGLPAGLTAITCYKASSKVCDIKGESTPAGVDSVKASCTSSSGTVVDHCPTAGLEGCCIVRGVGSCEYDAGMAATLKGVCPSTGGAWVTTPP